MKTVIVGIGWISKLASSQRSLMKSLNEKFAVGAFDSVDINPIISVKVSNPTSNSFILDRSIRILPEVNYM